MRTGIATVSISGVLEDKLDAISAAGFDTIEIFDNDLIASPMNPRRVAARCADLGLEIALFQPVRDVEGVPADRFDDVLHRFRAKLDLMSELGVGTVLACSNASPDAVDDLDLTAEQLHRVGQLAAEYGVTVAYEALAWGRHVNRVGRSWEAVQRADHPAIKLAVDTFHMLARGDHGTALAGIPGDRIGFLQVADAPLLDMNLLEWSRHFRCFPGQGTLDVTGVVAATLQAGYDGPVSLEVFSDVVREADPFVTARDAMRSLVFLEDQLAQVVRTTGPDGLRLLPPAASSTSAAFLEIVDARGGSEMTELLAALGFTEAGRHRSKPVSWWRQGGAHVVVNQDAGAGATTALGVSATPAEAVAARSEALLYPAISTIRGTGEAVLPGISSPAGQHLFVSDLPGARDHWQRDFDPTSETDVGTWQGLDHVALSVLPHQLNQEVAFFRTLFGLEPGVREEFMDPHGRLHSLALRAPRGDLRIVLNVTEAPDLASHPLGITQVAFRCDDVAASVKELRSRGVSFMPVPDNYYVDLAARFRLEPDRLNQLREHQMMFDRVGEGERLHAYTGVLDTGFYVELLERRDGYDGYGSANTFVRLAVQAH